MIKPLLYIVRLCFKLPILFSKQARSSQVDTSLKTKTNKNTTPQKKPTKNPKTKQKNKTNMYVYPKGPCFCDDVKLTPALKFIMGLTL